MIAFVKLMPLLLAAGCIAAGLLQKVQHRSRLRCPVYTEAVVVSCVRQQMYRQRAVVETLAPVVSYTTPQGEQSAASRRFVPEWQYRYRTGEKVRICYEKTQPGLIEICDDSSSTLRRDVLLALGFGILLAYAVLWIQYYI